MDEKTEPMTLKKEHYRKGGITRRINYLRNVIEIQDIVKEYGRSGRGFSQRWIYDNIISGEKPTHNISYSAFTKCMSVPAPRTELEKLLSYE